jgi:hypothetical protein
MVKCPDLWKLVEGHIRSAKQLPRSAGFSFDDSPSCYIRGSKQPGVVIIDFPLLLKLHAGGQDAKEEDRPEGKGEPPTLLTLASAIVVSLAKFLKANPTIRRIVIRADTHSPIQKETTQKNRRDGAAKAQAKKNEEKRAANEKESLPPYSEKDYYIDVATCQLIERATKQIVKPVEFGRLAMNRRELMHTFIAALVHRLAQPVLDESYFPWSKEELDKNVVWTFDFAKIETGEEKEEVEKLKDECDRRGLDFGMASVLLDTMPRSKSIVKITPICLDVHPGTTLVYPNEFGPVRSHGEADPAIVKWVERYADESCIVVSRDGDVMVILAILLERRMQAQFGAPRPMYGTWTTPQWHQLDVPTLYWFRNGSAALDLTRDSNSMYNMNEAMMKLHSVNWSARRLFVASYLTKNDYFLDKQLILPFVGVPAIAEVLKDYTRAQIHDVMAEPAAFQVLLGRMWVRQRCPNKYKKDMTWDQCKQYVQFHAENDKGKRAPELYKNAWVPNVRMLDRLKPIHRLMQDNWTYWELVKDDHPFQPNKAKVEVVM